VQTAPDLASIATAIVKVYEHVKKHLMRSGYPLVRTSLLLEAVSRQVGAYMFCLLEGVYIVYWNSDTRWGLL